jgi:hypothetical protein
MAENANIKKETRRMQKFLDDLNVPLTAVWIPKPESKRHGEIDEASQTLLIYDADPEQAWKTFIHEILEFKLQDYTRVYRTIINGLIEVLEKTAYAKKEEFLNFCSALMEKAKR